MSQKSDGSECPLLQRARRAMGANVLFYKEPDERCRAIHSFVLGIKRGKAWWKERIWSKSCWKDQITVKKSPLLFQIERISPVPLYLKMTFSPVVLYKTSNGSNLVSFFLLRATGVIRSSCSFCKEWPEWFAPVTLFVKSDRSNSVQSLFWKRAAGWFAPVPVPF